jgi:hypothetical protein
MAPNPPGEALRESKFEFGQYVTSGLGRLLSKSSTPERRLRRCVEETPDKPHTDQAFDLREDV